MIGILEFALESDEEYRSFTEQIIKVGYLSKTKKGDESYYTLTTTEQLIMLENGFGGAKILGVKIGSIEKKEKSWMSGWRTKSREASPKETSPKQAFAEILMGIDSSTGEVDYIVGKIKWLMEDGDVVYGNPD